MIVLLEARSRVFCGQPRLPCVPPVVLPPRLPQQSPIAKPQARHLLLEPPHDRSEAQSWQRKLRPLPPHSLRLSGPLPPPWSVSAKTSNHLLAATTPLSSHPSTCLLEACGSQTPLQPLSLSYPSYHTPYRVYHPPPRAPVIRLIRHQIKVELFTGRVKTSRVGSGRFGPGSGYRTQSVIIWKTSLPDPTRLNPIRPDSTRPGPTRLDPTREVLITS